MLIRFAILWAKSCWRSAISWAGLALCTIRAIYPIPNIVRSRTIIVLQLGQFGDMVLTLPLLDALRKCNPQAHLRVVTTPAGAAVAKAFGAQNEVLVPKFKGDCSIALDKADLIIHLRGGLRWVLGAYRRVRAGFVHGLPHRSALRWSPLVLLGIPLNRRVPEHQYATFVRIMQNLGLSMPQRPMIDFETPVIHRFWPSDVKYVAIHAGGNWLPRRWSEEKFFQVCAYLWHKHGLHTLLISAHETPALKDQLRMHNVPFHELNPENSVFSLAGMIKGATFFLGNDSGPAHLAAALNIPVVILYGPQDPRLFGVLSENQEQVKCYTFCSPCWQLDCPFSLIRCMNRISVGSVLASIASCAFDPVEKLS